LSFVSGTTNQRTVQAINASGTLGTAEVLIDGISVSEGSAWYSGDDYSEMIKISDDTFDLVGDETVNMNLACIEIEGVDGLVVPNELS
jgi:hypothetical protein